MHVLIVLIFCLLSCLCGAASAQVEKKHAAIVIGNGAYLHADKLANSVLDSQAVRNALIKIGFSESEIIYGENLNKRELERAIGRFALLAKDADVAITYYAGHGSTFSEIPYLVPIDANFTALEEMP